MKILSKVEFNCSVIESLFTPGGTLACLEKTRFDMGKYKASIIGREVPAWRAEGIRCVWAEKRKDKDGEYYALFCIPAHRAQMVAPS